jgi:hypothetical protein
MKTFRVFLLFALIPFITFSQIVIDQNDMPADGDTIRTSLSVDIGMINYEETGNNFIWDFSELVPFAQSVDTFVSVQETPWLYQLVFFLSSNLAKKMTEFDQIPGFQVTDIYEFYKNSSSDFRITGNAVTLSGIPLPNKFQSPDIVYKFPLNPGNIDSSFSNYEFYIPGIGYSGGWKKRVNHTDGWGTLITPYGSFQTIRVQSDIIQFDSLYIDTIGIGFPIYRQYTEYKWLGDGFGLPLCTVTDDGLLPTISYIDSVRSLYVGIPESIKNDPGILVYPNPSKGNFNLNFITIPGQTIKLNVFDLSGSKVFAGNYFHTQLIQLSMKGFEPGTYFLFIETGKEIFRQRIILIE